MSSVVKGIGKAVSGLLSGVKKAFKSVTKSTLGKSLLIAGAVFLGGGALGMWQTPFDSINGVFARAGPAAAELNAAKGVGDIASTMSNGAEAASAASQMITPPPDSYWSMTADAGGAATDVARTPFEEAAANAAGPSTTSGLINGNVAPPLPDSAYEMAGVTDYASRTADTAIDAAPPQNQGVIGRAMQGVLDFYKGDFARAALTQQIGGAIRGAFSPSPQELAEAQFDARRRYDLQRAADRNANYNVASVRLPRPGIINGGMR